jgi:hypothetical protein
MLPVVIILNKDKKDKKDKKDSEIYGFTEEEIKSQQNKIKIQKLNSHHVWVASHEFNKNKFLMKKEKLIILLNESRRREIYKYNDLAKKNNFDDVYLKYIIDDLNFSYNSLKTEIKNIPKDNEYLLEKILPMLSCILMWSMSILLQIHDEYGYYEYDYEKEFHQLKTNIYIVEGKSGYYYPTSFNVLDKISDLLRKIRFDKQRKILAEIYR